MATLKEILGDNYREDITLSEIDTLLGGMKLADLSSGEYVAKGKYSDLENRWKKAEKDLADKMTADEKAEAERKEREDYYKNLEKENALHKYTSKLSKVIKDEKVLAEIAQLYAEGDYSSAIDKQNAYLEKENAETEKRIKDELMKQNPQANPQGSSAPKTRADIMAIQDAQQRQKAIAENIHLFT